MNSSRHDEATAEMQCRLETGTMRVRGAVGTGGIFSARANGFPPRLFVSGKSAPERGHFLAVEFQSFA